MGAWMQRAFAALDAAATPGDATAELRRALYQDGAIDRAEALRLLAEHALGRLPGGAGDDLLVEALVDFFALSREAPQVSPEAVRAHWGRAVRTVVDAALFGLPPDAPQSPAWAGRVAAMAVGEDEARALIHAFAADGLVLSRVELRTLARLFARAAGYPEGLRRFALEAVAATVAADGAITADEAALIQALVFGPGGDGAVAVTRAEAETLWRIDGLAQEARKHPAWADVFAEAISAHLLHDGDDAVEGERAGWVLARAGQSLNRAERALIDALERMAGRLDPRLTARKAA